MKIINLLQMNNWPIKKFIIMIFTFQLLLWGSIGLDSVGFRIPILRQLVCFIYLTFVPGIIILRVLRLHKLGSIESLLYSIGVSLSVLMLTGFFMNTFYPLMGISRPISIIPLMGTVNFIVLFLCGLCSIIDKYYSDPNFLYTNEIFSISSYFLYLIPVWTIIGTYFMNYYNNNSLLIVVIFLISSIPIFISFDLIPSNLYPLAIFTTSLSLLFHNSLISMYVFGWDIQLEYYLANKVISNSLWDPTMFSNVNSMLSIVFLVPIYSILSNLSLTWVFKIIYPAIFSLMPVGLYLIFKKQTTDKVAFMSVFFFASVFVFYTEMLQLARQQIAEFFFMLILLLMIQNRNGISNRILLILFSISVIVSHYGLSYIVLFTVICSLFMLFLFNKYVNKPRMNDTINLTYTLLLFTFLFSWYIYISNSSAIYSIIRIAQNIAGNFASDFLNPKTVQGLYVISKEPTTPLHGVLKYMHLFTQILISIGLYYVISRKLKKYSKFNKEYLALCAIFYLILIAAIVVPNFSSALNTTRLYHITLILLAPFCVIGGILLLKTISKKIPHLKITENRIFQVVSVFFAVFLLFNTGWIYEIVGDVPTSQSLNSMMDYPKFNEQEMVSASWIYHMKNEGFILADGYRSLLLHSYGWNLKTNGNIDSNYSYIYLGTFNSRNNKILATYTVGVNKFMGYISLGEFVNKQDKIYSNGGAQIYYNT
jgi:uncharacterized membrane protein